MGSRMQQYLLDGNESPKTPNPKAPGLDASDGEGEAMPPAESETMSPAESEPSVSEMDVPEEPSRDRALSFRKGLLLMEYELDERGLAIPGTGQQFPLTASPRDIGRFSVGMGVYLTSIQLFVMLALFMAFAVGTPLMIMNGIGDNFTSTYVLQTNGENQECEKPWPPSNLFLKLTLGSWCPNNEFSSKYSCPARCSPTQSGIAPNCSNTMLVNTSDPGAVHCDLKLIPPAEPQMPYTTNDSVPGAQLVLLLIGQLSILVWMLLLKRTQSISADQINASVITAGDYSVFVQKLKLDTIEGDHLIDYARHYGEVVNAVHIATVGRPIELGLLLETRKKTLEELRIQARHPKVYGCCGSLLSGIYWGLIGGFKYGDKAVAAAEAAVQSVEEQLIAAQKKNLLATGKAILTFSYEAHAKNILRDHQRSFLSKLIDKATFNLLALGGGPKIRGQSVKISRAPEPTDIWWENTWVTGADRWRRRLISNAIIIIIVALGGYIQFELGKLQGPKGGPTQKLAQSKQDYWVKLMPVLMGLVVVFVNVVISIVVQILSFYERWFTRSDREMWLTMKISTFYLLNSFVVPILIHSGKNRRNNWYRAGGLMDQALYIQLSNAVVPAVLSLFDPMDAIKLRILSKFARTQSMMDSLVMPHQFYLSERYAAAVKTLGLALFYMPALPISPFIGALALLISYWTDKYVALRHTQKPHNLAHKVTVAINRVILVLPLVQMVLIWKLYFSEHAWIRVIFWLGFAFWLLFSIVPVMSILHWDSSSKFSDWGTGGAPFMKTIGEYARPTLPALSQDLMEAMRPNTMGSVEGIGISLPEVYIPECPEACSRSFVEKVAYQFELPSNPYPANPEIMQGQRVKTGGKDNTAPPKLKSRLEILEEDIGTDGLQSPSCESEKVGGDPRLSGTFSPFGHGSNANPRPNAPVFQRQGSLAGVPYYMQAQLMHQATGSQPHQQGGAYPAIQFPRQSGEDPEYRPYFPVVFHHTD